MKAEDLKIVVQEKYGAIATQRAILNQTSCCGTSGCCGDDGIAMIGDEYTQVEGHNPDADFGLGCGIPTQYAQIKPGDSVLDLGSGAGNDCFIARTFVGEKGKVTGLDFTPEMIQKANENLVKTGFKNIEFISGDIENMPLTENSFDVIISNCVLNLVPDKQKAFSEIYRVLKSGGHFCISDVVLIGELPEKVKQTAALYAGCVSGAEQKQDYLSIIEKNGFKNIQIHKEKIITVPDNILLKYISINELQELKSKATGIFSITLSADK